jgi:Transglutaminase-like superfamily
MKTQVKLHKEINDGYHLLNELPNNAIPIGIKFKKDTTSVIKNKKIILNLDSKDIIESYEIIPDTNNLYQITNNIPIGKYNVYLAKKKLTKIYVVFNPYDIQYQGDKTEFLNENVFSKSIMHISGKNHPKWELGQFDPMTYETVFYFINKLKKDKRENPVYICRYMTDKCNCASNDEDNNDEDNDLLCGKWNGKYNHGTPPCDWKSSIEIIQNFIKKKYEPVKYGQCWVFAYLLMTLLRCICIPTRFIYNKKSAHISKSQTKYKNILFKPSDDSVWNFHCWNECYLTRDDLKNNIDGKYNGWQVIDATPLELSMEENSIADFNCGPCSVTAIKEYNNELRAFFIDKKNSKTIKNLVSKYYSELDDEEDIDTEDKKLIDKYNNDKHYDREFIASETYYVVIFEDPNIRRQHKYSYPFCVGSKNIIKLTNHYFNSNKRKA